MAAGETCVTLVEDDDADKERRHSRRWAVTRKKKNGKLMEVNAVTNQKVEDLWKTVDSGASGIVISERLVLQCKVTPSNGCRNEVQYVAFNAEMMQRHGRKRREHDDVRVASVHAKDAGHGRMLVTR